MKFEKKFVLGSAQFGMTYGISNLTGIPNQEEINSLLDIANLYKIKKIDTARSYGDSEKKIGKYFKRIKNKNFNITTKIELNEIPLKTQFEYSLKMLNCTHVNLLAHSFKTYASNEFRKVVDEGKNNGTILKHGVSLYEKSEIIKIINMSFSPDIIQIPINILDNRLYCDGIIERLYQLKILIQARSIFLQGLFYLPEKIWKNMYPQAYNTLKNLKELAGIANLSLSEFSLLWVNSIREVSEIIIGVENKKQFLQNIILLKKKVDNDIFREAIKINFRNEKILNPAKWKIW